MGRAVGGASVMASHIPPFHQQDPDVSLELVLVPVLSWFDWRAL